MRSWAACTWFPFHLTLGGWGGEGLLSPQRPARRSPLELSQAHTSLPELHVEHQLLTPPQWPPLEDWPRWVNQLRWLECSSAWTLRPVRSGLHPYQVTARLSPPYCPPTHVASIPSHTVSLHVLSHLSQHEKCSPQAETEASCPLQPRCSCHGYSIFGGNEGRKENLSW